MAGFWLVTPSLPPLNWFRAFEQAAKHLSFTGAAAELNLTQSAVSQHVRSLELRLGAILFVRKARGLALTDAGRRLLPHVADAMADLSAATALFQPQKTDDALLIACSSSFALLWLSPRLDRFLDRYPGTDLRIVSTLWPDDFVMSEADVQVRFGSAELVGEDATRLLPDDIVPVCKPDLAKRGATPDALFDLPLIETVGTADTWQSWAAAMELETPPSLSRSVDSHALALTLAEAGLGVALVNRLLAGPGIAAGRLDLPCDVSVPAKDGYFFAVRETAAKDTIARRFEDWLMEEIAAA